MKVTEALSAAEMAEVRRLREVVFIVEQAVPADLEWDGKDDAARHLLIWDGAQALGTLRWRVVDGTAKIERVCVAKAARGSGAGRVLMEQVLRDIRAAEIARAVLGAQVPVIGFYEGLGFVAEGPVFDDAGIPHRMMALEL